MSEVCTRLGAILADFGFI